MLILIKKHRLLSILVIAVVGVVGAITVNAIVNKDHGKPKVSPAPKSSIKQLSPQPAANGGEKDASASSSNVNQGTSKDTKGSAKASTTSSQWTTSESGAITIKEPVNNGTIKSGTDLIGVATVDKIQYRLIDDNVGVISQGFVNVVDGKFSATISFPTYAKSGRLDVFSTNSEGAEINEVQLKVNFDA